MKFTALFRYGAPFLGVLLLTSTASASANLFTPVTGSDFTPTSAPNSSPLIHTNGTLFNPSASLQTVEVSLGHSAGGSGNTFTIFLKDNGIAMGCTIFAVASSTGVATPFPGSSPAVNGETSFTISTSLPTGDFFYSLDCSIPQINGTTQAGIVGVSPNH